MQWKAEEREARDAVERRSRLRLRGHPPAERLAAGDQRHVRQLPPCFGDCGAHRRMRDLGRINTLPAFLHVGKLVAQARDAALGQPGSRRRHERMRHARARAMREHEAGGGTRRDEEEGGDGGAVHIEGVRGFASESRILKVRSLASWPGLSRPSTSLDAAESIASICVAQYAQHWSAQHGIHV